MKHVRRFFLLVIIMSAGAYLYTQAPKTDIAGEASAPLLAYYQAQKIEKLNREGVDIFINGSMKSLESFERPKVSSQGQPLLSTKALASLFRCQTARGDGYVFIQKGEIQSSIEVVEDEDLVDAAAAANNLGIGYQWDIDEGNLYFEIPDDRIILPAAYDLRQVEALPPVGNQGESGTCWAFSALGALSSSMKGESQMEFAVDHMSLTNGFDIELNEGGENSMALAYLSSWSGPVLAKDDPYGDGVTNTTLSAVKHFQEGIIPKSKDYKRIKELIYTYGGVETSMYSSVDEISTENAQYRLSTSAYYCWEEKECNHDVVIVGWDDNYSKTNFKTQPQNNGAFICRNSWGTAFGDGGYFYVSYEDCNIGKVNVCYTTVENTDNYDYIYQSDLLGWTGSAGYDQDTIYMANVYTAKSKENLKAISFYTTDKNSFYDMYVVSDFKNVESLKDWQYMGSGWIADSGYYTVDVEKAISFAAGSSFAVVIRLKTENASYPAAIECVTGDYTSTVDLSDGQGYISPDGRSWTSIEEENQSNLCLKAFTDQEE